MRLVWPSASKIVSALVAAWLLVGAIGIAAEPADGLRAGAAKKDITPPKPVTLAGYSSRTELSQGVHDPLSARVVAFEQQGRRMVLVSTDLIGFRGEMAESVRKAILTACQLQPSELFLTSIHTHSGPILTRDSQRGHANNVEYAKALEPQLVEVVREAMAAMAPAGVAFGAGASPVGVNRRETVQDASGKPVVRLGRNPTARTDREVQVLKVSRANTGELMAVVFAYATHSTSLGPRNYQISGDVHGLAEQFVEKHLGRGVIAPAFAGASGDIDPWYRVLPEFNTAEGWIPEPVLMGTMLGEEVAQVSKGIQKLAASGPIKTALKTLLLPGKPRGKTSASGDAASVPFNVTVGRVGDVAIVGLGGEVFNEIGKAIKLASPFSHTIIVTHCNGGSGYLPTKPSYPEGGYEVESSPFAPGAGEQVVQEAVRMLREL